MHEQIFHPLNAGDLAAVVKVRGGAGEGRLSPSTSVVSPHLII